MILSDRDLAAAIESGRLKLENWSGKIGPASIDVYLDDPYFGLPWWIESGEFMLASTREVLTLPADMMAQVQGCSSIGRTGLFVQNAGLVDPGFSGTITLELLNAGREAIALHPGQRIAQLSFCELTSPAERPYGSPGVGRYQGQRGATPARPELAVNPLCGSAVPCAHDPEE